MPLAANADGVLTGKFTIPAAVPAGRKLAQFVGSGGSKGECFFDGGGEIWTETRRQVNVTTSTEQTTIVSQKNLAPPPPPPPPRYCWKERQSKEWINTTIENMSCAYPIGSTGRLAHFTSDQHRARKYTLKKETYQAIDPLAQTFRLEKNMQASGVNLYVVDRGAATITVQLRETSNGVPTTIVLGVAEKKSADLINGQVCRWEFFEPVSLLSGTEYAIVILTDDANASVGVAEMGKWDVSAGRWVTSQPYTVGVLLSSSNASTWTPHQDVDLYFDLLEPRFASTVRTIELGDALLSNASDLMIMANVRIPDPSCRVEFLAVLPNGSTIALTPFVATPLPSRMTGVALFSAKLYGTAQSTPTIEPEVQIASGALVESAEYISRAIPCGLNGRVVVLFDAKLPSGASCSPAIKGIDAGDSYTTLTSPSVTSIDQDWAEYRYELAGVNENAIHLRLSLAGSIAARPLVRNLRFMVL